MVREIGRVDLLDAWTEILSQCGAAHTAPAERLKSSDKTRGGMQT
jgi:hypothetical protein